MNDKYRLFYILTMISILIFRTTGEDNSTLRAMPAGPPLVQYRNGELQPE